MKYLVLLALMGAVALADDKMMGKSHFDNKDMRAMPKRDTHMQSGGTHHFDNKDMGHHMPKRDTEQMGKQHMDGMQGQMKSHFDTKKPKRDTEHMGKQHMDGMQSQMKSHFDTKKPKRDTEHMGKQHFDHNMQSGGTHHFDNTKPKRDTEKMGKQNMDGMQGQMKSHFQSANVGMGVNAGRRKRDTEHMGKQNMDHNMQGGMKSHFDKNMPRFERDTKMQGGMHHFEQVNANARVGVGKRDTEHMGKQHFDHNMQGGMKSHFDKTMPKRDTEHMNKGHFDHMQGGKSHFDNKAMPRFERQVGANANVGLRAGK